MVCKKCGGIAGWDPYFQSWICTRCGNQEPKPSTNYDRIISMKPEVLAIAICSDFGGIPWCKNIPECQDTLCVECVVKWLKQEVSDGDLH